MRTSFRGKRASDRARVRSREPYAHPALAGECETQRFCLFRGDCYDWAEALESARALDADIGADQWTWFDHFTETCGQWVALEQCCDENGLRSKVERDRVLLRHFLPSTRDEVERLVALLPAAGDCGICRLIYFAVRIARADATGAADLTLPLP